MSNAQPAPSLGRRTTHGARYRFDQDQGALDVEMTSIAAMEIGFVVAAGVQPPIGGYVARYG